MKHKHFLFILIALLMNVHVRSQNQANFVINIPHQLDSDTVWLEINRDILVKPILTDRQFVVCQNGKLIFSIDNLHAPAYINLTVKNNNVINGNVSYVLFDYLIEARDSINITMEKNDFYQPIKNKSSSKGAQEKFGKYTDQYLLHFNGIGSAKYDWQFREKSNDRIDVEGRLQLLDEFRQSISDQIYQILKANILGRSLDGRIRVFSSQVKNARKKMEAFDSLGIVTQLSKFDNLEFSEETILYSRKYQSFLLARFSFEKLFWGDTGEHSILNKIQQFQTSTLKDKLTLGFVINNFDKPIENMVAIALERIQNSTYKDLIYEYNSILKKGSVAGNFSLPNTEDKLVSLSDYNGKVVLLDFWYTGCSGCLYYYQNVLKVVEEKYKENKDVVFITISIDNNIDKWKKSIQTLPDINSKKYYTSNRVINLWTNGKGIDHPIITMFKVGAFPRPILLDRKGRIFSSDKKELEDGGISGLVDVISAALKE